MKSIRALRSHSIVIHLITVVPACLLGLTKAKVVLNSLIHPSIDIEKYLLNVKSLVLTFNLLFSIKLRHYSHHYLFTITTIVPTDNFRIKTT